MHLIEGVVGKNVALFVPEALVNYEDEIRAKEYKAVSLHEVVEETCHCRLDHRPVLRLSKLPATGTSLQNLRQCPQDVLRTSSSSQKRK